MHVAKILIAAGVVGVAGAMAAFGPDDKAAKPANASGKASAATAAKYEKLKSLAGVWQTGDEDKDGAPDTTVIYRLVSGGNSIAEFLMPGSEHEMVTMYHLDGDSIVATHYCALGNQPRMRSKGGGGADAVSFEFVDGTNMNSPADMHMHALTLTWKDADHVTAAWSSQENGKPGAHSPKFSIVRVKDAEAAAKIATGALSCCGTGGAACCEAGKAEQVEKK